MIGVALGLVYLAVEKNYEPMILLPIGFGTVLANIPFSSAIGPDGFLTRLYEAGIITELFPLLVFIGIGTMIDFTPLIQQPVVLIFGAIAQLGIFATVVAATALGFNLREAASIGIIGAADGPTAIFVATRFASHLLAPISVAAYSYIASVPVIQPLIIRLLTTKNERLIRMQHRARPVPRNIKILFPILVTLVTGTIAPISVALVGSLMFGNLMRESGVVDRLVRSSSNELVDVVTMLLGLAIGSTMTAERFLTPSTLAILGMGLLAFALDTACGVLFAKLANLFLRHKINPMIGACGISAFPMSARVVQKMAQAEDPENFILMQAVSVNVGGQIASLVAGAIILTLVQ
ncbi:MAG TPA: sodium ion-translocating decarboxylase subunit beta [Firmicutes bacterium]|nr:sodium ion-translocating decarboxylase subunit beta [Bacillota bacterium]